MEQNVPASSTVKPMIIPNPVDANDAEVIEPEQYYYVLQYGKIAGPFTIKRVVEMAVERTVGRRDFVQKAGTSEWLSLPVALNPAEPPPAGTSPAPDWLTIASWLWMRLRYNLDEKSLVAGSACLFVAVIGVLVCNWNTCFWMPFFLPSAVAAITLLRRARFIEGGILTVAVALFPFVVKWWSGGE